MALFDAGSACGLFAMPGWPTMATLTFERAAHSATTFGHISLSFASAYTITVDMQPGGGGFVRLVQGQLEPMAYTGTVQGSVDMQRGDRVSYLSSLLEIANVQHFGMVYTDVSFQLVR